MIKRRTIFLSIAAFSVFAFANSMLCAENAAKPSEEQRPAEKERSGKLQIEGMKDRSESVTKFISQLTPDEIEKFKKLQKENPDAYKEEIKKKLESRKNERDEQTAKLNELVEKYRNSRKDDEKMKIKEELKILIKAEFDKKMESSRQRLEQAEKQLQDFKAKYEDRKKNADQIVEGRITDLITDPNMKW
ncbi:MAG TPA: hypothetical protein DCZ94_01510 [Lentisphaeria bacterium]|nr:MAG: hypothetical protein A2X48_21395 [Lentisphaerae bacterium GWF2_49_21]HBC85608.1 hypothetical protein [Lentisphaeria bacterium]